MFPDRRRSADSAPAICIRCFCGLESSDRRRRDSESEGVYQEKIIEVNQRDLILEIQYNNDTLNGLLHRMG